MDYLFRYLRYLQIKFSYAQSHLHEKTCLFHLKQFFHLYPLRKDLHHQLKHLPQYVIVEMDYLSRYPRYLLIEFSHAQNHLHEKTYQFHLKQSFHLYPLRKDLLHQLKHRQWYAIVELDLLFQYPHYY